jgi:hypothetical protein
VAKFGDVFSTTLKVIGSLFLVSIVIGVIYAIVAGIGSIGGSSTSSSPDYKDTYLNSRTYYDEKADTAPTKMPLSKWKNVVADEVRGHCIREGMTSAEVEKAVGKPMTAKTVAYEQGSKADVWEYTTREAVNKPCTKYDGEKCVDPTEYETKTATLYFSPNGHLTYPYLSGTLKIDVMDYDFGDCH